VYPESAAYRWRSEGYATTTVGPHGMMGRPDWRPSASSTRPGTRWAFWGDSQAEGVCVSDDQKLWAAIEQQWARSHAAATKTQDQKASPSGQVHVLPFAASGDDGWDWYEQIPRVERAWDVQGHLILIAELSDLRVLAEPIPESVSPQSTEGGTRREWLRWTPDFVVHAARGLLLDPRTRQLRRLRFRPGPLIEDSPRKEAATEKDAETRWKLGDPIFSIRSSGKSNKLWGAIAKRLREQSDRPILLIYAPLRPLIVDGRVLWKRPETIDPVGIDLLAEQHIGWVDCYEIFVKAGRTGRFPHGFHNGQIGNGHLNTLGYHLIAEQVCKRLQEDSRYRLVQQADR